MKDDVYDQDGRRVATIRDGNLFSTDDAPVGTVRRNNVYDCNGKFIYHLSPQEGEDAAGRMTNEAVWKLFHPKPRHGLSLR